MTAPPFDDAAPLAGGAFVSDRVPGLLEWHRAVAGAKLTCSEKAVLYAYIRYADWQTGEAWPSVATIARGAGLSPRRVTSVRASLTRRGVLRFVERSKGGRAEGGRPKSDRVRLNLQSLRDINPDGDSGLAPSTMTDVQGSTLKKGDSTLKESTFNPETASSKPPIEPPIEQTISNSSNAAAAAVVSSLMGKGISQRDAERLAALPHVNPMRVRFAIHESTGQHITNPPGFIIRALEDPDEPGGFLAYIEAHQRRAQQLARKLGGKLGVKRTEDGGAHVDEAVRDVLDQARLAGWRTMAEVVEAGVLGQSDIMALERAELARKLSEAAVVAQAGKPVSRPGFLLVNRNGASKRGAPEQKASREYPEWDKPLPVR